MKCIDQMPAPSDIALTLRDLAEGALWKHISASLLRVLLGFAIGASLAALLLSSYLRNGAGVFHQLLKYAASLVLGAGILSMHFTGMAAMQMLVPAGADLSLPVDGSPMSTSPAVMPSRSGLM